MEIILSVLAVVVMGIAIVSKNGKVRLTMAILMFIMALCSVWYLLYLILN